MRYYPIFVNLEGRSCLVVGAGAVGRRKVSGLLERNPAEVLVVDLHAPSDDFLPLLDHPALRYETRQFADSDLDGRFLVIASTDNEELNWRISRLCQERGILCNIVDQPEKCSFIVPASFMKGDLTLAISTGGSSPALAKKIRRDLEDYFGSHYGAFTILMARLRPHMLGLGLGTEANTEVFRSIVDSDVLEGLKAQDRQRVEATLRRLLPPSLHPHLEDVLHGLA